MRNIQRVGLYNDTTAAPSPENPRVTVKLGIRRDTFEQYAGRRMASAIAQYYGIVQDGLLLAHHLFRGLQRPLLGDDDEDMNADGGVLVYTWRSLVDFEWVGSPYDGRPERIVPPPPARVFVVLVRQQDPDEDGIVGSIERWNWVREDPKLLHAPVDWEQRYGTKLWSKSI